MEPGTQDPQAMQAALDQLAEVLAGSDFRGALMKDPRGAATAAGVSVDDLPDGLLAALGLMSDEELRIVARVQQSLKGPAEGPISVAILF